jgi:hypothetical protein
MNVLDFLREIYIQERYEPIGLQILKSGLITKNPIKVIENTQEILSKKNKTKLVEKLEDIKNAVFEGGSLVEILRVNEFLSKKTYEEFKNIEDLVKLEAEHIESYINKKIKEKKLKSEINKAMMGQYVLIIIALLVGLSNLVQFKAFIVKYMLQGDSFLGKIMFDIANNPLTTGLLSITVTFIILVIFIKVIVEFLIGKNKEFYDFVSLIKILRNAGVSYTKIFQFLAKRQWSKKVGEIIIDVEDLLKIETPAKALIIITQDIPIEDSVIFIDRISVGDDKFAWNYLEDKIYQKTDESINRIKNILPIIVMLLSFAIFAFSLLPMIKMIQQVMTML